MERKKRQIGYLNRVRGSDPDRRTFERAFLNEQNEVGLVLNADTDINRLPNLMQTILPQMAREFQSHDLVVVVYASAVPPRKVGTVRADAARRTLNYLPAE